jgi:hypothetical protein
LQQNNKSAKEVVIEEVCATGNWWAEQRSSLHRLADDLSELPSPSTIRKFMAGTSSSIASLADA